MSRTEKIRQTLNGVGSGIEVDAIHAQPALVPGRTAGSTLKSTELQGDITAKTSGLLPSRCTHASGQAYAKAWQYYYFSVKSTFILLLVVLRSLSSPGHFIICGPF